MPTLMYVWFRNGICALILVYIIHPVEQVHQSHLAGASPRFLACSGPDSATDVGIMTLRRVLVVVSCFTVARGST